MIRRRHLSRFSRLALVLWLVAPLIQADEGNHRIKFDGRLMDQFGDPVPDAVMQFAVEVQSSLIRMPFGIGVGPVTVRTDRDGFFHVSVNARSCSFDRLEKEGYWKYLIGRQSKQRVGTVYYYALRYFPADVVCSAESVTVGGSDLSGAVYTYSNAWSPYQYVLPAEQMPAYVMGGGPGYLYRNGRDENGDLWISAQLAADGKTATIRFEVPGGGLVAENDVGAVIAPEGGYQTVLEVTGTVGENMDMVRFFARNERNGTPSYSLYELVGGEVFSLDGVMRFRFDLDQRMNPYGSRNLEMSEENRKLVDREYDARDELERRIEAVRKAQGDRAAHECWSKGWDDIHARRVREHKERRERSQRIFPEVMELEKRRLEYKPIMEAVLAGADHPACPRAGIKGGRTDARPARTPLLLLAVVLGLLGGVAAVVVLSRRRKPRAPPAAPPGNAPTE